VSDPAKQCGECSLCCKVMGIPELRKPKDTSCLHIVPHKGCDIYAERPQSCRNFACHWLLNRAIGDAWKPSTCHMVIEAKQRSKVIHVDPDFAEAWRAEPYFSEIRAMAKTGLVNGAMTLVIERFRTIVILPDEEIDLGLLGPNARIAMTQHKTPDGVRWRPHVLTS
jgi:hypothetical protein